VAGGHGEVAAGIGRGLFETWLGIENDLLWSGRLAYHPGLDWGLELQAERVNSHDRVEGGGAKAHFTYWGLGAIVPLSPTSVFSPYFSGSLGLATLALAHDTSRSPALGLALGAQWHFRPEWSVYGEAKDDLAVFRDNLTHQVLFSFGLRFSFASRRQDTDGDGVGDARDRCPRTPPGAIVDEHGCPSDADADGVFDGLDRCPDTPIGTPVDEHGCPR